MKLDKFGRITGVVLGTAFGFWIAWLIAMFEAPLWIFIAYMVFIPLTIIAVTLVAIHNRRYQKEDTNA